MDSTDYILFVPMFFLAIYLWLESQDFGVAIVAPMVAQNEEERKTALNLLKPGLDGNEAWAFLCAGVTGALFSNGRFNIPESTFWPLGIILTGMIVRLAAAFWGNIFQQPLLLRGVRFITIINVISAGGSCVGIGQSGPFYNEKCVWPYLVVYELYSGRCHLWSL